MNNFKSLVWGIVGVFIIFLIVAGLRLGYLHNKDIELKTQYETLKKDTALLEQTKQVELAALTKQIAQLQEKNAQSEQVIVRLQNQQESLNKPLSELEAVRKTLTDKDAIISNLDKQVALWKEKFSLAQEIIANKDSVIFSLTEQYKAQVQIAENWKREYTGEYNLRVLAEQRIAVLEKSNKWFSFDSKISKTAAIILGGYIIYSLIKK
jgi:chromosome segregation ATPase